MSAGRSRRFHVVLSILVVATALAVAGGVWFFGGLGARAGSQADPPASAQAGVSPAPRPAGETPQPSNGSETPGKEAKKTPIPVSVSAVGTGTVSSYITSTANLVPEKDVKVLAEAEGRLADLLVEEGDRITRGQVLASLVRDEAEIAAKKAELRAANARLNQERARKVAAENLMSREEFDRITLENDVAQQELAEAKWRLEKTTIRAPFTGRVTERMVKMGQHVRPGDILFGIADFDPLIAWIYLPERDVLGLQEGREVRITLKAGEDTRFQGRVRQISPVVDTATGTVKVTVEAIEPPNEVRPGAFVTIEIVRETRLEVVLVPREAVVRELQDAYVFVTNGEVAQKRSVSLGIEEGGRIETRAGLSVGEQVVVSGQGGLKDGSPVRIVVAEASTHVRVESRPTRS